MSTNFFQTSNDIFRYGLRPNGFTVYCYLVSCTESKPTRFGRASRAQVRQCRTCARREAGDSGRKPGPTFERRERSIRMNLSPLSRLMKSEGYDVKWTDTRKSITYTCPNGMKCRDDRLHEAKYTKEMMEHEFRNRAEIIHGGIETTEPSKHGMDSISGELGRADSPSEGHFQETGKLPDLHPNRGTDALCAGVAADGGTGWEEEGKILFSAETKPATDTSQSNPVIRTARLIGALGAVVQFGAALDLLSIDTPVRDATTIPHRIDRKRWKKLTRKRLSMGHKIDDHATTISM